MKPRSVELLLEKAAKAGLANLTASAEMIEDFDQAFEIGLALHACGNATDYAMLQSIKNRAAFAMCPCCVGKLKFSIEGGSSFSNKHKRFIGLGPAAAKDSAQAASPDGSGGEETLEHPRSQWLRSHVTSDQFALIAKAGDISHGCDDGASDGQFHGYEEIARTCKANIEYDRAQAAAEKKYTTGLYRLINGKKTGKAEIILGIPDHLAAP
uniref:Methyltransferase domain-containing protein n=1 Tax=Chloropicon laureae TaxID=464258 RepID=A0A7S3E4V4_9CHLO|mmetsp:Transcript_9183/g.23508  ORF Transcript_9183/g.23508 Transcript_9183/m.23508 type:complete len:211 (+) Transcript_9183:1-633(+)